MKAVAQVSMLRLLASATCALFLSAAGRVTAQPADGLVVPDSGLDAPRLLDLAATAAGVRIEYDAREIARLSPRTLRVLDGLSSEELWAATNEVLASGGLFTVATEGSPTLRVVAAEEARRAAPLVTALPRPPGPSFVRFFYKPQHRSVESARSFAEPIVGRTVTLTEVASGGGGLVLEGATSRVSELVRLLGVFDAPVDTPEVERLRPRALSVNALISLGEEMLPRVLGERDAARVDLVSVDGTNEVLVVGPGDTVRRAIAFLSTIDGSRPLERRVYATLGLEPRRVAESLRASVLTPDSALGPGRVSSMIVADELTGTVVVTSTLSEHELVEAYIDRLGMLPSSARRVVRVFEVTHRDPDELVALAQSLVADGGADAIDSETPDAPAVVPERRDGPAAGASDGVSLIADVPANRLIVTGPDASVARVLRLLEDLDVRERQVSLEVTVVTLTEGDSFDLGVELTRTTNSGDTLVNLASVFGLGGISIDGGLTEDEAFVSGSGFTGVVLEPGEFSVLVRALETLSDGRSVNRTRLLVTNGEEASLTSAVQEPFLQTNASDTVATTSFGGSSNAGLDIAVTPEISSGGYLRLTYNVSLSSFTGESADPALPPPRQENQVASVSLLPDGFTVAVGGLEIETEGRAESRIPLLGSIPIIGNAFKSQSESSSQTRFYVFIRPVAIRSTDFADLREMSDLELERAGLPKNILETEAEYIW